MRAPTSVAVRNSRTRFKHRTWFGSQSQVALMRGACPAVSRTRFGSFESPAAISRPLPAQKINGVLPLGGLFDGFEGDFVAEAFELADGAAAGVVGFAFGDDRGSLFAVELAGCEHLPAGCEDLVGGRDDRFLVAA